MPTALAISCSKNEGDIIESFVRYNADFIDKFCIIDMSDDNTPEILQLLKEEGFDIDIYAHSSKEYLQDSLVNSALRKYEGLYDFYFFLDIDEILVCKDLDRWKSFEFKNSDKALRMFWNHFVPTTLNYFDLENPLKNGFNQAWETKHRIQKIALPKNITKNCLVGVGSHQAIFLNADTRVLCPETDWVFEIAHFPVRSREQITIKIINAAGQLSLKKNRFVGEGHHVTQILDYLKVNQFELNLIDLQHIAVNYGVNEFQSLNVATCGVPLGGSLNRRDIFLKYVDLMPINSISRIFNQLDGYVKQLQSVS